MSLREPGADNSPGGSDDRNGGSDGAGAVPGDGVGGEAGNGSGGGPITPRVEPATDGVQVQLQKLRSGSTLSFALPVPRGVLASVSTIQVLAGGKPLSVKARELLAHYDASGKRSGVAALQIQLPGSSMPSNTLQVDVRWAGGNTPTSALVPYAQVSAASPAIAKTAVRSISSSGGQYRFTETSSQTKTLFTGRTPHVVVSFPDGYLARTNVIGLQLTASQVAASKSTGLKFLSEDFKRFSLSSMYADGYAYNPDPGSVVDLESDYSAWLYDRCATYIGAFAHFGDTRFAEFGFKSCTYFATRIGLSGASKGVFTAKEQPDIKYSHIRGLYAYYALTGDESALAAGKAIAEMWLAEPNFVQPYRAGSIRGADKLWTERLLAASLEGLLYGYRFTGDTRYLIAVEEMVDTAYRHITGNAGELSKINPGANFPPQNCFIHSGLQQSESTAGEPWCSPWMSELVVDSLLQYQVLTNDPRVDEIFVRLGRFLRDVGTSYFTNDLHDDSFLKPSVCDDPAANPDHRRRLVPLYGAGLNASGARINAGDYSDFEHCADASALSAAALRGLKRTGQYDKNPIGPFKSEGESFMQLHHELLSCAKHTFAQETRAKRDPAAWTSKELAAGASNPAAFIQANKIGFPKHAQMPTRKLSWWFNTAMQQYKMLDEAGITVGTLTPGRLQPSGCR